jgi:hypothetical protein
MIDDGYAIASMVIVACLWLLTAAAVILAFAILFDICSAMTYITITDAQTLESMSIVIDSVNDTATLMLLNHTAYMQVNGTEIVNNVYSGVI